MYGLVIAQIYCISLRSLPSVHMVNEKRRLLHIGLSLPKGFQGYQGVRHQVSGPCSFHFEKTIFALCAGYGPLFRSSAGAEER